MESSDHEDEDIGRRERKRIRRMRPENRFVDVEAMVDGSTEEDEDYDFDDDFIDRDEIEEAKSTYVRLMNKRREEKKEELDVEREEQRLRALYGRKVSFDKSKYMDTLLRPTIKDPKLWLVSCPNGREWEVMMGLYREMRMFRDENPDGTVPIKSVMFRRNIKGYIYIEAYGKNDFLGILEKIRGGVNSQIRLVPLTEMIEVMEIKENGVPVEEGMWVRVKRGKYSNDLAQVIEAGNQVSRIRLIPRLEVDRKGDEGRAMQRLFDPKSVSERDRKNHVTKQRGYWVYRGEYFRDGFLEKDIRNQGLIVVDVDPTVEELEMFSDVIDVDQEERSVGKEILSKDDEIVVVGGDLVNKEGRVKRVEGDRVVIVSMDEDRVEREYTVMNVDVKKRWKVGDNVNVVGGMFRGRRGMVVDVKDDMVTVFDVERGAEIRVASRDLGNEASTVVETKEVERRRDERGRGRGRYSRPRDPLMGQTVVICSGPLKGQMGMVQEGDAMTVSVELHSNYETVMVDRSNVKIFGEHGTGEDGGKTPGYGGMTPRYGGRTPGHGGMTPGYGGATPGYGGRTPKYGGATPRYRP